MKAVVTGASGFIGSHLVDGLMALGWEVTGIDALTAYYNPAAKLRNLLHATDNPGFRLIQEDLRSLNLAPLLDDETVLFHLAGQPGVADSWATFGTYLAHNVEVTQRVLDAAAILGIKNVVLASSSSVYGNATRFPVIEECPPAPISPYGVTKSAAEHVARAYATRFGMPVTILRYFTVYGPRQRPDMAIARFIEAVGANREIQVYGDGCQTRDVTFVSDVVDATIRAGQRAPEATFNVAGGTRISVLALIERIAEIMGKLPRVRHCAPRPGDVAHTEASLVRARDRLGFIPAVGIQEGLERQIDWWTSRGA